MKLHKSTITSCQKVLNLNDIVKFEHVELIPGNRYCVWGCKKLEEHNQFNEPDDTYLYYTPVESSLPDAEGFKNCHSLEYHWLSSTSMGRQEKDKAKGN